MPANLSMRDFAAETPLVVVPCVIFSSHLSVYHLVRSFAVLLFAFSSRRSPIFPFALHWLQQFEKRWSPLWRWTWSGKEDQQRLVRKFELFRKMTGIKRRTRNTRVSEENQSWEIQKRMLLRLIWLHIVRQRLNGDWLDCLASKTINGKGMSNSGTQAFVGRRIIRLPWKRLPGRLLYPLI